VYDAEINKAQLVQLLDLVVMGEAGELELQPAVPSERGHVIRRGQILNGAMVLLCAHTSSRDKGVTVTITSAERGDSQTIVYNQAHVCALLGLSSPDEALGVEELRRILDAVTLTKSNFEATRLGASSSNTAECHEPLGADELVLQPGSLVDVVTRKEILSVPSSRWRTIFGEDWERKRLEYAEWADAEAKISIVDAVDRTVRIKNLHELGGAFLGSSNSAAWWPAELLRHKQSKAVLNSILPGSSSTQFAAGGVTRTSDFQEAPGLLDPCANEPDSGNSIKELRDGLLVKVVSKARMEALPTRRWFEVYGDDFRAMRSHLMNWAGAVAAISGDVDSVDKTVLLEGFRVFGNHPDIELETWWPAELVLPFE